MKTNLLIAAIGFTAMLVLLTCAVLLHQRFLLATACEYRVCSVQDSRVTFVNGVWQGRIPMAPADPQTSIHSCPDKWAYLKTAGSEGWELVTVVPLTHVTDQLAQELYLRRAKR